MSKLIETEDSRYYASLEDAKADGYYPVKVDSFLQFYALRGRTTTICMDNIEPLDTLYLLHAPKDEFYYVKEFRKYLLKDLLWKETALVFDDYEPIDWFIERLNAGQMWLLLTIDQVNFISDMLIRMWKVGKGTDGKLGYKDWLWIMNKSLQRDHYKEGHQHDADYKTMTRKLEMEIVDFWKNVKPSK